MYHPARDTVVKAVLGPTNTGKTYYAIERMLGHESGIIGLPLRLLAREVYDQICEKKGAQFCALITGEEKIVPKHARYYVCTVEAMPVNHREGDPRFAFMAIDEVQLMAHPERGHIFTDRVLHARGTQETLFLGAETARDLIRDLLPDVRHEHRERFSTLSYNGETKLTRLPKRSVIVAFSASEVYALAELMRRHRGGAAVVMGALSPRTRNAQAELYQSGDVDFLIATDAVGMGLNLDTDHVAFASMRKYDGTRKRRLTAMEAGQIAGRAGRFRNHGTFGTTGDCRPMDDEMIHKIENHIFEPLRGAEWRSNRLDFTTIETLLHSLADHTPHKRLRRVASPDDEMALDRLTSIAEVRNSIKSPRDVRQLWDICQVPDFRNLTIDTHARLLIEIHTQLGIGEGTLPDEWMAKQVSRLDHTAGGVDILSGRLAHIRTLTYCANKASWMRDPQRWIARTRDVEDRLSDALHESLIRRFVDRRTSALLKGIGAKTHMDATITPDGEVMIEGHKVGALSGLKFTVENSDSNLEAKALREAAQKVVGPEIDKRLNSIIGGDHAIFVMGGEGEILWGGKPVAQVVKSPVLLDPDVEILGADMGNPVLVTQAQARIRDYLRNDIKDKLSRLIQLRDYANNDAALGPAKGFAYRMFENFGYINREAHGAVVRDLDQENRAELRPLGVTFGHFDVYMRDLLKPAASKLLGLVRAFGPDGDGQFYNPPSGVTSYANDKSQSREALAAAGYRPCGPLIVRFDIIERLSKLLWTARTEHGGKHFQITTEMLSILGCSYDDMIGVLGALGYKSKQIPREQLVVPVKGDEKTPETPKKEAAAKEAPKTETAATQTPGPAALSPAPGVEPAEKDSGPTIIKQSETGPVKNNLPAPPKTKTKKSWQSSSAPLTPYEPRPVDEKGDPAPLPETVLVWFKPFKKRPARHDGNQDKLRSASRSKKTQGKPAGKKGGNDGRAKTYSAAPKKIDPNNPFAALAALKTGEPKS